VLVTITGASGVGKTTLMRWLMRMHDGVKPLLSTTTRKPRESDIEGEYEYITDHLFQMMERIEAFLWAVEVHGNHYGTRIKIVRASLHPRFNIIAPLVHSAVVKLHAYAKEHGFARQLRSLYILSPGPQILKNRLEGRESHARPEDVSRRLEECIPWDEEAQNSSVPYLMFQDKNNLEAKSRFLSHMFLPS